MSQNLTIYRLSKQNFERVVKKETTLSKVSDEIIDIDQCFMGLEYIFCKIHPNDKRLFIDLFLANSYYFSDSSTNDLSYVGCDTIIDANEKLQNIDETILRKNFNSKELNEKKIYPSVWNDEEKESVAFNFRHLFENFLLLKNLLKNATLHKSILVNFLG